jgi:hypothetical protein
MNGQAWVKLGVGIAIAVALYFVGLFIYNAGEANVQAKWDRDTIQKQEQYEKDLTAAVASVRQEEQLKALALVNTTRAFLEAKNADEYNAYEDQLAKMSITNPGRNPTYIHDHSKATASLNLGGSNFSSLGGGWKSLERAENKKTSGNNIPDIKEKALNKYLQNLELKEEANRLTADGYVKNSETGIWSFPPATPATKKIKRGKKKK